MSNTLNFIEKVKAKVLESHDLVEHTNNNQKNLLNFEKDFNLKIRNYIESDINEKNSYKDGEEKITLVKTRIEVCKQNITKIKEKMINIKNKYNLS